MENLYQALSRLENAIREFKEAMRDLSVIMGPNGSIPTLAPRPGGEAQSSSDRLTAREKEIYELLKEKVVPNEIAKRLNLSVKTVYNHRKKIREKIGTWGSA